MHRDDAGNGDAALLPAGEAEGRAACEGVVVKTGKFHGAFHALSGLFFITPQIHRPEGDVFGDGFFEKLVLRVLENHADRVALGDGGFGFLGKVDTIDGDFAAGRMDEPIQVLDECRFPAPCMTDNADEFSFFDGEIDIIQGRLFKWRALAINITYMFDAYGHSASPSSSSVMQSSGIS